MTDKKDIEIIDMVDIDGVYTINNIEKKPISYDRDMRLVMEKLPNKVDIYA